MSTATSGGSRDSLAGRLTRTLIVWVGGVWLLCVIGATWYVDGEINHNFDSEMIESAHRMQAAFASGEVLAEGLPGRAFARHMLID